jgi:ribosome-associated protein
LDDDVKLRLARLAGRRVSADGIILIEARRYRDQERNRVDARERLAALIRRALQAPEKRKPTRPTHASKVRRVEAKRQRSGIKKHRQKPMDYD